MPLAYLAYWVVMGLSRPSLMETCLTASSSHTRPQKFLATLAWTTLGAMKNTANVATLTMASRITTPIRRRMMKRPMRAGRCGRGLRTRPQRPSPAFRGEKRQDGLAADADVDVVVHAER